MLPPSRGSATPDRSREWENLFGDSLYSHCRGRVLGARALAPRTYQHHVPFKAHLEHGQRTRRGNLLHFPCLTIVSSPVPGTLQRPIRKEISQRHRKMLVSADIAHG